MNYSAKPTSLPPLTASVQKYADSPLESLLKKALNEPTPEVFATLQSHLDEDALECGPVADLLRGAGPSVSLAERVAILQKAYPYIQAQKDALRIEASLLPETFQLYIPLAVYMARRSRDIRSHNQRAALFGINGGQGSGKTTIHGFLNAILTHGLQMKTVGFSIDDVYKTYEQRQAMGADVHPLFAIRSVAGTHDIDLANRTMDRLLHADAGESIPIPCFDKMAKGGQGDRVPESQWHQAEGPIDVVIFEGWFVGAQPQDQAAIATPINEREAREDPTGVWRETLNQHLATDYRALFERLDDLFVIQVRSMEDVFHNRELQEQHLRNKLNEAKERGEDTGESGAMSPQEVIDFISLYERTTRHMLETLPDVAKAVFYIGDHHKVEKVRVNRPSA